MSKRSYPFHSSPISPYLSSREEAQQQLPKGPLQKKMSMSLPSITTSSQNSLSTWRMPSTVTSGSNRHSLHVQAASTAATTTASESAKKQSSPPSANRGRKNMKNLQLVVPPVRSSISAPSSPQLPPPNPQPHAHTHNRRPSTPICVYQKNKTSENGAADPMALMSRTENAIGEELPYKDEPICILPNLFLGSELNAANRPMLNRLGIKYILNVAMEVENPYIEEIARTSNPGDPLQSPGVSTISSETSFRTAASSPIGPTIQVDSPLSSRANSLRRSSPSNSRPTSLSLTGVQAAMMGGTPLTVPATSEFKAIKYRKFFWTHNQENLPADFILAFSFIDEARSAGKNILVHCQCGVSRSASLVIAYVMKANRMTLNQAYEFVKDRSPYISPNMSLVYQLVDFEKTLKLGNNNSNSSGGKRDTVRTHSRSSSIESDLLLKSHRRSNSFSRTNSLDSPPRTPPALTTEPMTLSSVALHQSTVKGGPGRFHVITATSPVSPSSPSTLSSTSLSPTSSTTSPTTPSTSPSRRSSRPPPLSAKTSKSSLGSSRPRSPCRPIDENPQEQSQQGQSAVSSTSLTNSNRMSTSSELSSYYFADFDHDASAFALTNALANESGAPAAATTATATASDKPDAVDKVEKADKDVVFSPTRASPPVTMTSFAAFWSPGSSKRSRE